MLSSVLAGLFGTRYRSKAEDEDLSDDMEARPDEVFREEARRYRIAPFLLACLLNFGFNCVMYLVEN